MPKPLPSFVESLLDLLAPLGEIVVKRMFGGFGIYKDGIMFGLVAFERFFLKVDTETLPQFEQSGCEPFVYEKSDGKTMKMSYYEPPEEAFSSSLRMKKWALLGWQAAQRNAQAAPVRKKRKAAGKKQ
jgi:DNA transformation protein and related proteins